MHVPIGYRIVMTLVGLSLLYISEFTISQSFENLEDVMVRSILLIGSVVFITTAIRPECHVVDDSKKET